MSRRKTIFILPFLLLMVFNGCLEPYAPPAITSAQSYLVVDGSINASDNSATITLTRSQRLDTTGAPEAVSNADVFIEDTDGSTIVLASQSAGVYSATNLALNEDKTYRLHIGLNDQTYYSDYVPINQSPPIDSVGWFLEKKGADLSASVYVNTHGTESQSRYYRWTFQETWIYTAAYFTEVKFVKGQVYPAVDSTYFCWRTNNSTSIYVGSATQLGQNVINHFPLTTNSFNSLTLRVGYSILVNQFSLTKDAFDYYQQLKSNTENLGTIFGPQPSRFTGNIHSATNAAEPVFGYFFASSVSNKRIFITPYQLPTQTLPAITGYEDCQLFSIGIADVPNYKGGLVFVRSYGFIPEGYYLAAPYCVDCRMQGGTNLKPDYWY
jgi:hypothetical protein